jgi:hypothetical protein
MATERIPSDPGDRSTHVEGAEPEEGYAHQNPGGMPYTVFFPDGDGYRPADLEHAAPLPRVGDTVEYIDERGGCHRYVVREVIHTVQVAADARPSVGGRHDTPAAFARDENEESERPGDGGSLRAGLPKVLLAEAEPEAEGSLGLGGFRVMHAVQRVESSPSEAATWAVRGDVSSIRAGCFQVQSFQAVEPEDAQCDSLPL